MNENDLIYTCSEGESFDSVSLMLYGDEKYACELLRANPSLCHLLIFEGGEVLNVPVVEIPEEDEADESGAPVSAPWR